MKELLVDVEETNSALAYVDSLATLPGGYSVNPDMHIVAPAGDLRTKMLHLIAENRTDLENLKVPPETPISEVANAAKPH
eukprot:1184254-Prorocentrum_minimum.AAC.7